MSRHSARLLRRSTIGVIFTSIAVALPLPAQRGRAGTDSALRADYRDLGELLSKLPTVAPPPLDEARALWLDALPLSCLDRLQPRPGRGGLARGVINVFNPTGDSSNRIARRDTSSADSAGRGGGGANNGAGYFWVATYSLIPDHDRLRAFWGCSDWHSAVASTWVAVRVLKSFPNSTLRELTREKLNAHLGKSNLDGEIDFFHAVAAAINPIPSANQTGLFERPYGFAWLLKLASELRTWPDTQAQRWSANVTPLATWMADSLGAYFSKLVEPVRSGAQTNTAQSMTLALDYADVANDGKLRRAIVAAARKLYLADTTCATQSERVVPTAGGRGGRGGRGGSGRGGGRAANVDTASRAPNDLSATPAGRGGAAAPGAGGPEVISPCLSEAALMSRVLEGGPYVTWLDHFLPPLQSGRFAPLTEPIAIPTSAPPAAGRGGAAPDTSAGGLAAALATERARLAGLSFARAQSMERIALALPANDPRVEAWHRLSAIQADRGFQLLRDDTAGMSWLPAQALLYETVRETVRK
jgi:hypothetical protein